MKKQKTLEEQLYFAGWFLLIGGIAGIFVYFQFIMPKLSVFPCFFYHVLGIYCPGCGGTRAIGALLQGKPLLSFWYHPLVPYTVVLFWRLYADTDPGARAFFKSAGLEIP